MQRGDLGEAPLSVLLTRLAADKPSGCLHVTRAAEGGLPAGPEALVHLRGGRVYAASAGAERFLVGTRLVTSFGVDPAAVNEALAAQETDLTGWRVGEILVHLGYVDATAVETISREQVLEALTEIEGWRAGSWRFRPGVRTRAMLAEPIDAADAVAAIGARQQEWLTLQATVPGPRAIARLTGSPAPAEAADISADAWALLSGIDGMRTVADLGRERGFSLLETARGLSVLVGAKLAEVQGDPNQTTEDASVASMFTALEQGGAAGETAVGADGETTASGDSLLRVSAALSALMGSDTHGESGVAEVVDLTAAREAKAADEAERRERAAQLDAERHEIERLAAAEVSRREDERRARDERAAAEERERAAAEAEERAAREAEQAVAEAAAREEQRRRALEAERREREAAERAAAAAEEESLLSQELDVAALLRHSEEQKLAEDRVKLEARRQAGKAAEEAAARAAQEAAAAQAAQEAAAAQAAQEAAAKAAEEEAARAAAAKAAEAAAAQAAQEAAARAAEEEAARAAAAKAAEAAAAQAAQEAAARAAEEEAARAAEAKATEAAAQEAAARAAAAAVSALDAPDPEPERVPGFRMPAQGADRSAMAGALSELAASSSVGPPEQPAPAAQPDAEPVAAAAASMGNGAPAFLMPGQNDTASLLRELSSLGLDDDVPQAPRPPRPAPRSAPPGADSKDKGKKKKGLFGR